jgi:hypothetical protein
VHKEAEQRSKIQGARGLDLKDLLLLPSSPPSLPRLLVLITLGLEKKKSKGCSSTHNPSVTDSPPFLLFLSLFVLPPGHNPSVTDSPPLLFLSLFVLPPGHNHLVMLWKHESFFERGVDRVA